MGGWASKIVRPNRAFSTSLEPETENYQRDGGLVWFHLSSGFVRNTCFPFMCISSKTRNLWFFANSPYSTPFYDPVNTRP